MKLILTNKLAWVNGLYVGLSFSLITVFGAFWAVPLIQAKLNCSLALASAIDAQFFLGSGLSCPLFGYLSMLALRRRPLMQASALISGLLCMSILCLPITQPLLLGLLLFLLGLSCGAYMLAYTIANELAPKGCLSMAAGFTNTLAMVSALLLQPLIGYFLDTIRRYSSLESPQDYQLALLIIPLALLLSLCLIPYLPEKLSQSSD